MANISEPTRNVLASLGSAAIFVIAAIIIIALLVGIVLAIQAI